MFHRPILAWAAVGWLAAAGALARPADFDAAIALYDAGKYSAAQRIFEQIAAREPDNPEVNFRLGSIALWFDDAGRGRELLEKAVRAKPDDARYQSALGNAYGLTAQKAVFFTKFGWARKCRAAYLRAVELEPENPEWHWSLLGYFMQAPGIAGGGIDKAYAEAAIIRKLSGAEGRIAFATLDLAEEKYDKAFREFDEVLRVSPDDFVALYQIGRCSALSGRQLERGRAALERCLQLLPPAGAHQPTHANVHYRLGNVLEKMGHAAAARAEYAAAFKEDPDLRPDKDALKN